MIYAVIGLASAWLVALALWYVCRLECIRLRRRVGFLESQLSKAKREAMDAEARSRGVGGTGEHGAPVIVPCFPVSKTWGAARDPRFAIPSGSAE